MCIRDRPGFDIVLMGHDHARECKKVMNVAGDSVLIIDPASNGVVLSNVEMCIRDRNCIVPVPHLGHLQPESLRANSLSHESSSEVISRV